LTHTPTTETRTLIDELLAEQRSLTAVERFAQKHERAELPLQERFYRDLLPATAPAPGEQYAFEVNLDQCTGCKACVAACHSLNGLEDDESWRAVGLLISPDSTEPFQQTVTTACHHCIDPGCLHGCPALAYEKDEITGIVRHLDDQCIGCQYCVLKCPYEVPRYSERLGIVRKCDMCANRLSAGEAPACVQSCPNEAIQITIVNKIAVAQQHIRTESFLPDTPDPRHTVPSTRYLSAKGLPERLAAADAAFVSPAPAHWPLVFMLVLTQASAGAMIFALAERFLNGSVSLPFLASAAALGFAGMAASILHLGRPLQAWRALLGVRRSWLSREILAFGAWAPSVLLLLAAEVLPFPLLQWPVHFLAAATGAAAVFCSIKVYSDTPREFWSATRTAPKFTGTALLLGLSLGAIFSPSAALFHAITAVAAFKFLFDLELFRHLSAERSVALRRSAQLQSGALLNWMLTRALTLIAGGVGLAQFAASSPSFHLAPLIFALLLLAEIIERCLYFKTVAQPIMPGGVR
jgi:formate dehydrogenase iron-sulfur subunit